MMRYLLDTNICIYIIKNRPPQVFSHLKTLSIGEVGISSITLAELAYGVEKSARPEQNRDALLGFVSPLEIVAFDDRAADHYGRIRSHLERTGQVIGSMDMLIAAHALSLGVVLVTNDSREFSRVPSLLLEDWV